MKRYILCCIVMLLAIAKAGAQDSYNDRVKKYVDQYFALAIEEQRSSGIPAAITLGQGILETEAGASELMTTANNHFGIKCTKGWTGDTFLHDDDAAQECFKKYKCAADSYHDHSDHLKKNPRYASLFSLSQTDYASWAIGLRKCGYATNPQYAQRLIKIIEDFKLQDYTYSGLDSSMQLNYPTVPGVKQRLAAIEAADTTDDDTEQTAPPIAVVPAVPKAVAATVPVAHADTIVKMPVKADVSPLKNMADSAKKTVMHTEPAAPVVKTDTVKKVTQGVARGADSKYDSGKIVVVNGMRAFYALKGEMLLQYAVKYNVRYPRLLEMNDLPDAPLPFNTYVYLEKKLSSGTHAKHTVKDGENLLMISQEEGVQLKKIMADNYLNANEEPAVGAILELQTMAARKPDIRINTGAAHKKNAILTAADTMTVADNDYISTKKAGQAADEESTGDGDREEQGGASAKQETTKDENLGSLKSELDKVVYADDSQVPQSKKDAQQAKKKPVQEVKPAAKKEERFYKVKRGETASGIAKRHNITVRQLTKWNDIEADDIRAGQKLRVKP